MIVVERVNDRNSKWDLYLEKMYGSDGSDTMWLTLEQACELRGKLNATLDSILAPPPEETR
jgi:hypothetical protein